MFPDPAISHDNPTDSNSLSRDLPGNPSSMPSDPRAVLEQQLRELDEKYEFATIEMNTPDGMRRLDDLSEERDFLLEELAALAPIADVPTPAPTLIDAHFLSQSESDETGQIAHYAVQAVQLYEDQSQRVIGRVLDVGRFDTQEEAAESYTALQETVDSGVITLAEVGMLAEAMADENGLDAHAWREMSVGDFVNYRDHAAEVTHADNVFAAPLFHVTLPDGDKDATADEPMLAALHRIGLEAPEHFNPSQDSFYDAERGERVINGIFQADREDPTRNCRPLFVTFTAAGDGLGFQAQAVEFGTIGSLDDVKTEHEQVQQALEDGVIHAALDSMAEIEALRLEPVAEPTLAPAWSRDID